MQALNTDDPMGTLRMDRDLTYLEPTSLIIRVHDNQNQLRVRSIEYGDLDSDYIPSASAEKYMFMYQEVTASKQKRLTQLFKIDVTDHLAMVKRAIKEEYGIDYPKIQ